MSNRVSVVLLLFGLLWIDLAGAQRAAKSSPSWSLSVSDGRLTANINRIPLRMVLAELAHQTPLRLSVNGPWRDYPVTAHLRAVPLDEALEHLLTGLSYAIVYEAASAAAPGSAATIRIGELIVFEKVPEARVAGSSEAPTVTNQPATAIRQGQATTLDTPPEWTAALQHPDTAMRLEALQRWAEQGAATPLDPLTHALVDPDESVRARAHELVERVWTEKAEARAR